VESAGEQSSPGDGSGESAAGVLDFVAHDGSEFQTDQAEADNSERIENEARIRGNLEVGCGDASTKARPDDDAENVEQGEQRKQSEGNARGEELVVGKSLMAGTDHIHRHADEIEHDRRHVEHVVGPVAPAREESVEVAENFFRPEVDTAFAGIAMGEFDDGDALGPEEQEKRDDPEPDGQAAVGGDRRDDVQIKSGYDEQKHKIAAP